MANYKGNKETGNRSRSQNTSHSSRRNGQGARAPQTSAQAAEQNGNMYYLFNEAYYDDLSYVQMAYLDPQRNKDRLLNFYNNKNTRLVSHKFNLSSSPIKTWQQIPNYQSFRLKTVYPGLLIGTGNPHDMNAAGAIRNGFTFDYVTGLPFLPGSSLKGVLRSYFPKTTKDVEKADYIRSLLPTDLQQIDLQALKAAIFDDGDTFLGAFPVGETVCSLLAMDSITPHKSEFQDPVPIPILKVKPEVPFDFGFLLKPSVIGGLEVSAEVKRQVFKSILKDVGIGAKTNVGFGLLMEE